VAPVGSDTLKLFTTDWRLPNEGTPKDARAASVPRDPNRQLSDPSVRRTRLLPRSATVAEPRSLPLDTRIELERTTRGNLTRPRAGDAAASVTAQVAEAAMATQANRSRSRERDGRGRRECPTRPTKCAGDLRRCPRILPSTSFTELRRRRASTARRSYRTLGRRRVRECPGRSRFVDWSAGSGSGFASRLVRAATCSAPYPSNTRSRARPSSGQEASISPVARSVSVTTTASAAAADLSGSYNSAAAYCRSAAGRSRSLRSRAHQHARDRNGERLSEYRCRLAGLRHFRDGSRICRLSAWADVVDAAVVGRVAA